MWVHINSNGGMGVEAQELLRWYQVPVCSIKRRPEYWEVSCLNRTHISTTGLELPITLELDNIKQICEDYLVIIGWIKPEKNHGKENA